MMVDARKEAAFEATIVEHLTAHGWILGAAGDFDPATALDTGHLFAFLEATQATTLDRLRKSLGDRLEATVTAALVKHLESHGTLLTLRKGFKVYGKRIDVAAFKPAHGLNPTVFAHYAANRLVVTRQVRFDPAGRDTLDLVFSLNGIPVATAEVKNPFTGQGTRHAVRQYQRDRPPHHPLLAWQRGALVHFAVSDHVVDMTTRLAKEKTVFLPFNKGHHHGAGNPPSDTGHDTAYLWQEVLAKDSLLDILARFVSLEKKEKKKVSRSGVVTTETRETLIFPRYHQLDCVRTLVAMTLEEGAGHNYLVQHSAGSGKSNSIAWLAYRLQSLHDEHDGKIFHSVVVITDRTVLDRQLQDTIFQIDHQDGVVERIDKNSKQLAAALEAGKPIVITTLQKFPFVAEHIGQLPDRRYAVIVDEAHSSQTGSSARKMKQLLGSGSIWDQDQAADDDVDAQMVAETARATDGTTYAEQAVGADADATLVLGEDPALIAAVDDEPADPQDLLTQVMTSRQQQKNLSFYAFTATPKHKTLEIFGRPSPADGKPRPMHLYSMRQAIEEKFILDVLAHYTTYKTYYQVVKRVEDDPRVDKAKARSALARFVRFHPHNVSQKVQIIAEHYRAHVRRKIRGKAKAMVVTQSRLHAVMVKLAFDRYLAARGYDDIKTLVAFSGTVRDPETGEDHTEVSLNHGIPETEVPNRFASDAFQILIVAAKYQTGFDQPLLHTMYVDKRLAGVQAVQTLSRLNRRADDKEDTFVLDFVNEAEEIRQSFEDFYEVTTIDEHVDPHRLNALQNELDEARIYTGAEVEGFARIFYKPLAKQVNRDNERLYRWTNAARERFFAQDDDTQERFRAQLGAFVRLYAFLSQVMPFTDPELERRYSFGRYLLKRIADQQIDALDLAGDVALASYRINQTFDGQIPLPAGAEGETTGPSATGTARTQDEDQAPLSEIIGRFNDRFGTDFGEAERLLIDGVRQKLTESDLIRQRAAANTLDNFAIASDVRAQVTDAMVEHLDRHGDIVQKYLDDDAFQKAVYAVLTQVVYEELRSGAQPGGIR